MTLTDSTPRFHRRRLWSRLKSLRPWILAGVGLAAVCFAGWVVLFSPWLVARHVSVAGETTVSARDVESAAGVSMGTPMLRLDLGRIHDRIAELPAVHTVTVSRSWPDTVSIVITERQGIATIRRGGRWWVLDEQGVIFRRTPQRDIHLPVLAVQRKAGADAVHEAASVISALPHDLLAETKRLTARSMDSITLRLRDKSDVIWGNAAESDRKVEVLKALLKHVKAARYDVSVPEQPTTSA